MGLVPTGGRKAPGEAGPTLGDTQGRVETTPKRVNGLLARGDSG